MEKPDERNLPQEHSSNTYSDLNCIHPVSPLSISGSVALKYSHKELLERGIYGDCTSQERLDYAVITSKPLTYNNICLFLFTLQVCHWFAGQLFSLYLFRPRGSHPLWKLLALVKGKRWTLECFKLTIKCSRPLVTHVTSAHTYWQALYIRSGQRVQTSSYAFTYFKNKKYLWKMLMTPQNSQSVIMVADM